MIKEIHINGKDCTTKQDLFQVFSSAFEFPDYFSDNWDSFDEIITDLSWLEEQEIALNLEDYHLLLSEEAEEEKDIFFDILTQVEEFSGKSFQLELVDVEGIEDNGEEE